ncbi:MAG TPA: hypothetical protein VD948_07505 [Rhodothermales bacterium]|nr:hypothetical protein [Rhodothermales bacterium]
MASPNVSHVIAPDQMAGYVAFWQRQLRMLDWTFEARIVRRHEMSVASRIGEVFWNNHHKRARVSLLDPVDHDPTSVVPYDMEEVLVHEMIHPLYGKHTAPETDGAAYDAMEVSINMLAQALVRLARQGTEYPFASARGDGAATLTLDPTFEVTLPPSQDTGYA